MLRALGTMAAVVFPSQLHVERTSWSRIRAGAVELAKHHRAARPRRRRGVDARSFALWPVAKAGPAGALFRCELVLLTYLPIRIIRFNATVASIGSSAQVGFLIFIAAFFSITARYFGPRSLSPASRWSD